MDNKIASEGVAGASVASPIASEEKICCTRCAAEIPDIDLFCPACGFGWNESRKKKILTCFRIYCIGLVLNILIAVIQLFIWDKTVLSSVFSVLSVMSVIVVYVYLMIFMYHCWCLIPKKARRASPGQYVWLQFVPFYQIYWDFPAYFGLIRRQNAMLPEEKRGNGGVVLTFLILSSMYIIGIFLSIIVLAIYSVKNQLPDASGFFNDSCFIAIHTVIAVLVSCMGYLAFLQLKKNACFLFELPAEEKKKLMMSVPGAPGAKKTPLWPVWTFGCGGSILFLFLFFLALVLTVLVSMGKDGKRIQCRNNMNQIGLALKIYSEYNKGQYPPCGENGLRLLVAKRYLSRKQLGCPGAACPVTPDGFAYVYLGGLNNKVPADTILAVYGTPENAEKDTRFYVLFADGSVQEVLLPGKAGYAELFRKYGILDDRNAFTKKGNQLPQETRDYILRLMEKERSKKTVL